MHVGGENVADAVRNPLPGYGGRFSANEVAQVSRHSQRWGSLGVTPSRNGYLPQQFGFPNEATLIVGFSFYSRLHGQGCSGTVLHPAELAGFFIRWTLLKLRR